jgi:hypothetical protein
LVRSAESILNWVIEYLNQERSIAGLAFWIHDNYVSKCVRFRAHQKCILERLFLVRSAESYISWVRIDRVLGPTREVTRLRDSHFGIATKSLVRE